jgi:phage terminase small subunit
MARPKTPSNILQLKGAFDKNPQRENKSEPAGNGDFVAEAPAHLSQAEAACWDEVVGLVPAGVLTGSDLLQVELVAKLLVRFREEGAEMPAQLLTRFSAEMGKIGLSPSSRAGLSVSKPKTNKFSM